MRGRSTIASSVQEGDELHTWEHGEHKGSGLEAGERAYALRARGPPVATHLLHLELVLCILYGSMGNGDGGAWTEAHGVRRMEAHGMGNGEGGDEDSAP
jgi:hypothetical protein